MTKPIGAVTTHSIKLVFAALMLVMVMASLDQSAVNTALPKMTSDLGGLAYLSWIVTAFMLGSTLSTPIYGKLSDMVGRRHMLLVSISIFLVASLLCGIATDMIALILFRGLQGLGAGGLMTLSQTVIGDLVEPRERGRYQGLFTGAFAISSVIGPLFGGILTTELSWRWIFLINLPIGAIALGLILFALKDVSSPRIHHVDYPGAALLSVGTIVIMLLLTWGGSTVAWSSIEMAAMIAMSLALLFLFIRREKRAPEPIIDLSLFHNRSFSIGVTASGMMAFAMFGSLVFLPLLFQLVLGLSPANAGLMMVPQVLAMLVSSIVGGRLSSRFGRPKPFLVAGVSCETVALCALGIMTWSNAGVAAFLVAIALLGFGMGIGMPNATVIVQNAVGSTALGTATSTMTFIRLLGGALGVAFSGGIVAAQLGMRLAGGAGPDAAASLLEHSVAATMALPSSDQALIINAYQGALAVAFFVGAGVMLCAWFVCLMLPDERLRRGSSADSDLPV
ncbi:MDR family MFS transporter [Sphingobium algorifonticola]|uniref:DHA2 family efflux MFS transporter permease subunit n=1 Tax=Sphingobium algorifonticola TaxID=2008318 RepID=A0A437J9Z6_9SPHN|nr:MDR family MFS transporter [Sphingobium algorifonticola]RVT42336.1 DHA2 family efflux MFS transporter permease subunit [Sphingobium algorifonticola]